jgi:phosphoglucosamine mutase
MTQRKYFGTDGIRGRVGSTTINPEFMLKLGWAVGRVLCRGPRQKVLIGKDTRVSGYMLESALEAGLSAAGVDVRLLGPMPTPAIAYLTQTLRATAGIVISASHNLFEDNGVKFFSAEGTKLDDALELAIEAEIDKKLMTVNSSQLGKASRVNDAPGRYIEFCKSTIPSLSRLFGLKIVVDCAHGATYHIAPNVFAELGAEVVAIGNKPDGFNINRGVGSTSPEFLQQQVLEHRADLGVALDGDGDRVVLVNASGQIVNGDQILYILAKDRYERGVLQGGIVGTEMSNYGLELALASMSIPFVRARVGDRYVLEMLKKYDWRIGGEPSGHIVCLDKTTTGDGIVAALQVMAMMVRQAKSLDALCDGMSMLPQVLLNLKTDDAKQLANDERVLALVTHASQTLKGRGRVVLRASGTEPVMRIMVEGEHLPDIEEHAQKLFHDIQGISLSEKKKTGVNA